MDDRNKEAVTVNTQTKSSNRQKIILLSVAFKLPCVSPHIRPAGWGVWKFIIDLGNRLCNNMISTQQSTYFLLLSFISAVVLNLGFGTLKGVVR